MSEEKDQPSISQEELNTIKSAKEKLYFAENQRKIAELELNNVILRVYLKNKLQDDDVIDEVTGKITKNTRGE